MKHPWIEYILLSTVNDIELMKKIKFEHYDADAVLNDAAEKT